MRSFAVIAGFAANAYAYAYGYDAMNTTSVAAPAYPATSAAPAYAASSAADYPVADASSQAPVYSTSVVKGLSTVCNGPTTLSVGTKTYTVTKSTTIVDEDNEYTTTYPAMATPTPAKGTSAVVAPSAPGISSGVPAGSAAPSAPGMPGMPSGIPYPSQNGTAPTHPAGTAAPTGAKPSSPAQFTGAAVQNGAAMLAIVGAVAAFL